jgi:hypothetical protein
MAVEKEVDVIEQQKWGLQQGVWRSVLTPVLVEIEHTL